MTICNKLLVLFFGLFALIASVYLAGCSNQTETVVQTLHIAGGQSNSFPINLKSGDLIEGSFTVLGPTDLATLDIKFAVLDPSGNNVFGPIQTRAQSFTYRAQTNGLHFLYVDNTYWILTSKTVNLTYTCPRRAIIVK